MSYEGWISVETHAPRVTPIRLLTFWGLPLTCAVRAPVWYTMNKVELPSSTDLHYFLLCRKIALSQSQHDDWWPTTKELTILPQNTAETQDTEFCRQLGGKVGEEIVLAANRNGGHESNGQKPSGSRFSIYRAPDQATTITTTRSCCHHVAEQQGQAGKTQ